jgi:hypothetical protein
MTESKIQVGMSDDYLNTNKVTYKLPSDLAQIELPTASATVGERVDDDELAFLLIIAQI